MSGMLASSEVGEPLDADRSTLGLQAAAPEDDEELFDPDLDEDDEFDDEDE